MKNFKLLIVWAVLASVLSVTGCSPETPIDTNPKPTSAPTTPSTVDTDPEQSVVAGRLNVFLNGVFNGCDVDVATEFYNSYGDRTDIPSEEEVTEIKNKLLALMPSLEVIDVRGMPDGQIVAIYADFLLICIYSSANNISVEVPAEAATLVDETNATVDTSLIVFNVNDGKNPVSLEPTTPMVKVDNKWYIASSAFTG